MSLRQMAELAARQILSRDQRFPTPADADTIERVAKAFAEEVGRRLCEHPTCYEHASNCCAGWCTTCQDGKKQLTIAEAIAAAENGER